MAGAAWAPRRLEWAAQPPGLTCHATWVEMPSSACTERDIETVFTFLRIDPGQVVQYHP